MKQTKQTKMIIVTDAIISIVYAIYATISAAKTDVGSWIKPNSAEPGHNMSMGEAIWHNIPHGIVAGLLVAIIVFTVGYAAIEIYGKVKETQK